MTTRVGYVVRGTGGLHPATAHIRVTRPLNRAVVAGAATGLQIDPFGELPDLDVLLVQRDAVPLDAVEPLFARARAAGVRILADVDDDFFSARARERLAAAEYEASRLASVEAVVRGADTVLASTPALAHVVSPLARAVAVVPNALDPEFWVDGEPERATLPADGVVRVLVAGSTTHGDDLELLRPVAEGLRTRDGRPIRLEVVGVHDGSDADWYDRVAIPDGWTHYPEFVRWMRSEAPRWSAGLAPLVDDPLNRAKSDIKALDYALLGLPVVASDSPAYRAIRPHGVRLVRRADPAHWRRAIVAAVDDGRRRDRLRRYVVGERLLGTGSAWERAVLGQARW